MKTKFGMSIGLALTLMVGVFATMLALGLFTTVDVQAAKTSDPPTSVVSDPLPQLTADEDEVDELGVVSIAFTTSDSGTLAIGETITVEFPGNVYVPAFIDNTGTKKVALDDLVMVNQVAATKVAVSGQKATVTVPAVIGNSVDVTVSFPIQELTAPPANLEEMVAIRTPHVVGASYTVKVSTTADRAAVTSSPSTATTEPGATGDPRTLDDRDDIFGVAVAHTPSATNANARITVDFYSPESLTANLDTITIEFADDVQVPPLLDERFISIVGVPTAAGTPRRVASPLDATVELVGVPADEPRVTLTVGDHDPEEAVDGIGAGKVSVIFRQGAGIKNPTEAGTWNVRVSTSKQSPANDRDDDSTTLAKRGFPTIRTIGLNKKSGTRGSTITAKGAGFKNSTTATVFLDENNDGEKQPAEVVLCDAAIDGTDTFTCDFVVNVPPFGSDDTNIINAIDGREGSANDGAPWDLDPQITAIPKTAAIGDTVTVDLQDFPKNMPSAAKFDVGGVDILKGVAKQAATTSSGPTGTSTHTITIPNGVALGKQALRVQFPGGSSYRVTMTITGAQLTVAPAAVVPNQSVTITGHGFTGNSVLYGVSTRTETGTTHANDIGADAGEGGRGGLSGIHIGGTQIAWDKIDDGELVEVDSGGNWVATVVIPVTSPSTIPGVYELKAFDSAGRPGVTQLTVKPRTIDFEPKESRVGTTLTVTGTGWVASNSAPGAESANISVDYYLPGESDSDASARANPDSDGNFTTTIRVPLNASIPSTNRVEVQYDDDNDRAVTETAAHRVPGATISITPSSGPAGP